MSAMEPLTHRIAVGFLTDTGRVRRRNEDAYALYLPYSGEPDDGGFQAVFAVADGMGGHASGDVASRFAADAAVGAVTSPDAPIPPADDALERWIEDLVRRINGKLFGLSEVVEETRGMGSTLTLAVLRRQRLVLGHVGDTRCYLLRGGELSQITEDHSWAAEQRRAGLITAEQEAQHPNRNVLTESLGQPRLARVFTRSLPLRDGDRVLLCSDGLYGPVRPSELAEVLCTEPEPQAAARRLVQRANDHGGPDNITAIVFDLLPATGTLATEPAGATAAVRPPSRRRRARAALAATAIVAVAVAGGWLLSTVSGTVEPRGGSEAAAAAAATVPVERPTPAPAEVPPEEHALPAAPATPSPSPERPR